jgi:hypothetical protein
VCAFVPSDETDGIARDRPLLVLLDAMGLSSPKPLGNTRRMVETAAHLVDHVIPRVPVRQWVLTAPKRVRYFLQHEPRIFSGVLRVFMRAVNTAGRSRSRLMRNPASTRTRPGAPADAESRKHKDKTRRASYLWAMLIARIYEALPLLCPRCGHSMKIVAFITEPQSVRRILKHLGEPTEH